MSLAKQDALLEEQANEIIERTRREVRRNPKNHISILVNQIATLSDINNERIAIIEKREEQKSGRNFIKSFVAIFALVFGYLAKTSEPGAKRTSFIVLTTIFGGIAGTMELLTFKKTSALDIALFFIFSTCAVTVVLVIFLGLSDGANSTTLNVIAGVAGFIGIVALYLANKRKQERDEKSEILRKSKLNERLDAAD